MEKTGWKSEILASISKSYGSHVIATQTDEHDVNNIDIKETAYILCQIGKEKDPDLIIDIERILLRNDLERYCKDHPQAQTSIKEAIKEVDGAEKALNIVKNKEAYQIVNDAHSPKDKDRKNGLPQDAFHVFINSHRTRLGNRIRSVEASFEERLLLKERYSNMDIALKEYIKLQAKALDITLPEKSKDMER